ncbi:hypothetical protein NQ314_012720 [Rhamnusium bicolor]|uniref:DDE Tnp4 domain-containing protein n=1 Tax=Rhamnusium bicolor TaxID=1586634 RepID=A0AAV8XAV2_9CUCU|nr:hypothetical protein NQ314_012720 [Rhamnusium bicolor]
MYLVYALSFVSKLIPTITNNGFYHLLGDGAYSITEWLLTPYKDYGNLSNAQIQYNKHLSATRVLIENAFSLLRSRFRQIQKLEFHNVENTSKFILSFCVLHNICIDFNDYINSENRDDPEPVDPLNIFLFRRCF